ncbi:MAG TPA: hypothetical protein VFG25_06945 [Nitrosopumilaceae archaeon]|nr:hypothetical protein [Nitrosopumilaceae archaeon]
MDKIRSIRDAPKQEYQLTDVQDQEIESESIWNTLHEFGISKEDIMKQNLSHEELYNIHVAVKTYQDCQKVLKGLEEF